MDTTAEEIIIRHTLPLDKTPPSDHSGGGKTSEDEELHSALKEARLENSENIENPRRFYEVLEQSFPLCKGSSVARPLERPAG